MMYCGANLSIRESSRPRSGRVSRAFDTSPMSGVFYHPNGRACIKVSATHSIFFQRYWHPGGKSIVGRASDHYRPATIVRVPKECQAIKGLFAAAAWLALVPGTESRR